MDKVELKRIRDKVWNDAKKLDHWIVYCIPNTHWKGLTDVHYCGQTNNPYDRMRHHRLLSGRDTSGWYMIGKCNTRKEAKELEAHFHSKGYAGKVTNETKKVAVDRYTKDGEFIDTFESIRSAKNELGIDEKNIGTCCRGKAKSAGGYKWKYNLKK